MTVKWKLKSLTKSIKSSDTIIMCRVTICIIWIIFYILVLSNSKNVVLCISGNRGKVYLRYGQKFFTENTCDYPCESSSTDVFKSLRHCVGVPDCLRSAGCLCRDESLLRNAVTKPAVSVFVFSILVDVVCDSAVRDGIRTFITELTFHTFNPWNPHDALKHHFTSLKNDLIFYN